MSINFSCKNIHVRLKLIDNVLGFLMIQLNPSSNLIDLLANKLNIDKKESPGVIVTAALKYAINNKLEPGLCKKNCIDKGNFKAFRVSPLLKIKLNEILKKYLTVDSTATLSSVTLGMLCAVANENDPKSNKSKPAKKPVKDPSLVWLKKAGLDERIEQAQLINSNEYYLASRDNPIVMAEASVGVGKSYAIACSAIKEASKDNSKPVIVAAPNYQITKQLCESAESLIKANNLKISIATFSSRSEFVSEELMKHFLKKEGHSISDDIKSNAEKLLKNKVFDRQSYEEIGVNCSHLLLSSINNPNDLGEEYYYAKRSQSKIADIIFCTHAMLGIHVYLTRMKAFKYSNIEKNTPYINHIERNKQLFETLLSNDEIMEDGILPSFDLLIIDEAHQLDSSFKSILSKQISLSVLERIITDCSKEKLLPKKSALAATNIINDFKSNVIAKTGSQYPKSLTTSLYSSLENLVQLKTKALSKNAVALIESMYSLKSLSMDYESTHNIHVSPIRKSVKIYNKGNNVQPLLNMTWLMAQKALLVSGTLATSSNANSYSLMSVKLGIPNERVCSAQPIETSWLRENVTLHIPTKSFDLKTTEKCFAGTFLLPPKKQDRENIEHWCRQQAQYLHNEILKTKGGSIVFCTSYDQIEVLHKELNTAFKDEKNIFLLQSIQGITARTIINQYKHVYAAGLQPVWIAIANSGTGTDITDSEALPENDHLLQSVFITRIPNLTTRNSSKFTSSQFLSGMRESIILTKQIAGRLVRRPNRKDMHLHLMDARFHIKKGSYRVFSQITDKYSDKKIMK